MGDPMTDERLAEIRERAQAAPPAPWRSEDDDRTLERWVLSESGELKIGLGYVGNRTEDVAAFIVHAREDVPALLAEVERLRADLAQSRWCAQQMESHRDAYRTERDRLRLAWQSARRGRAQVRAVLATVSAERDEAQRLGGRHRADRDRLVGEVDRLVDAIARVSLVRSWQDEDGRGFVYVADLVAALTGKDPA